LKERDIWNDPEQEVLEEVKQREKSSDGNRKERM
jgi:hypothetical protein